MNRSLTQHAHPRWSYQRRLLPFARRASYVICHRLSIKLGVMAAVLLAVTFVCCMRGGEAYMQEQIPIEVREHLSAGDGLGKAAVAERYPDIQATLNNPKTRVAILNYLASDDAWKDSSTGFTMKCIEFLRSGATQQEAHLVRTFLLHADHYVRLRAYEFLMTFYFPDKNREAMFVLLQNMILDDHDAVRTQGARFIERANVGVEFRPFLKRWRKTAAGKGWEGKESVEIIDRLLKQ